MDASSDAESDAESTRTPPRASDRHCGVVRLSHRCLNSIRQLVLHAFVCLRFCATPRGRRLSSGWMEAPRGERE
jgi:hypothetical protein